MPVVLRKRKAPQPPPEPPAKKKTTAKVAKAATSKAKEPVAAKASKSATKAANGAVEAAKTAVKPAVGDVIALEGFGGEVETNDGKTTTLKVLVDESKAGVVLFTYPKASTPGCTNQVCLFRDSYADLTAGGLAIYGLSADSPRANTTFKEKQRLPYPLLCDPAATLISAIGLAKLPRGTARGVFVVDAAGKVLAAEAGGPARTVEVVRALVADLAGGAGDAVVPTAENGKEEQNGAGEMKDAEETKGAEANGDGVKPEENGKGEVNGNVAPGKDDMKTNGGEEKE